MKTILITGGFGLIGSELIDKILSKDCSIKILSRNKDKKVYHKNITTYRWDVASNYIDNDALKGVDVIIHLAGANIGSKRWTKARKREIISSRINSTLLLYKYIDQLEIKPSVFVSASAIGYYGAKTTLNEYVESDLNGTDFLANVCKQWEGATNQFKALGIRTVILRTGVVLSKKGGVLSKMILPVKIGLNAPLGTGNQYIPWIHIEDLCNLYIETILDERYFGVFNAVSPEYQTNHNFSKQLSKTMNKSFFMPNIPSFVLKFLFGEMAIIMLHGSKVSSKKIIDKGFKFKFPTLNIALVDLLKDCSQKE